MQSNIVLCKNPNMSPIQDVDKKIQTLEF